MKLKTIIRFVFFLLLPLVTKAQTYSFVNYGIQEGLSQSNVSAIVQDESGFFWIATEHGISKFDGVNFTNYTAQDGLSDNHASALLIDKQGNLWIGHGNGSLTRYDGKTFTVLRTNYLPKDKPIYALYEDHLGHIWISTASGAIMMTYSDQETSFKTYSSKEGLSQYVFSVQEDQHGNMWFLTDVGIKILSKKNKQFEFFNPKSTLSGQVTSLAQTASGHLLIGTSNGTVYEYDITKQQLSTCMDVTALTFNQPGIVNAMVYALYEDRVGQIWASIYNRGVCRYRKADRKLTFFGPSNGLPVSKIKCIAEDREGSILLGTLENGIEVFKGETFVSFSTKDGLVNNQVWSICQDKQNKYWFGTNEGITVYDPAKPSTQAFKRISLDAFASNNVRAMVRDQKGILWIGTWGGKVIGYNSETSQTVSANALNDVLNPYVSCLLIDSKNKLWVGTVDGLSCMNLNTGLVNTYRTINGLVDNDISCLWEDSRGRIWIGTKQKGISIFNGSSFENLHKNKEFTNTAITSITEDLKQRLWIGTEGGGVFVYDHKIVANYTVKEGLVSDFVTLVTTDKKGNIWLGTNKGLCKYDEVKKTVYTYSKNEGFTGIETKPRALYNDDQGNIWFGTVNGVFKYTSAFDHSMPLEPLTHITRFRVSLKDYPVTSAITLPYHSNSLHFDYIGISLSNPSGVMYQTWLEGYEKEWKLPSKQAFDIYSNLPPGKYVFKLIACNSKRVCNQTPITVSITITPPFWKTWWFYATVVLISLVVVVSYIKLRERRLMMEKKLLEDKVKARTAEIVEKNIELDEKNKDITASIRYAKRIQNAILPPDEFVRNTLPNTFVLFKPKDIVSGDFYWVANKKNKVFFAAVDCTGHGVPGAFMSIIGHNVLDQIIGEQGLTKPSAILDALNKGVSDTLRQSHSEDNTVKDGMDIALCAFDYNTRTLDYAGAYNPLWLIRNGVLTEIKADKFPIGNLKPGESNTFTNHTIPLQTGDTIYVFSDGYADQFGGPYGKKFKYNSFKQLLLGIQHMSMPDQKEVLLKNIEEWQGNLEQVDDILVIGTRL